jgi:hypothetical protein
MAVKDVKELTVYDKAYRVAMEFFAELRGRQNGTINA